MNKRDVKILIDCDEVLCLLVQAWCSWLNNKHGTNVSSTDVVNWDIADFFPSLSTDEIYEPLCVDDFWRTVEPKPGAIEWVKRLVDDGYTIYICTASDYRTIKSKFDWVFKRYFPFISWNQVIVTQDKSIIRGDIIVDDAVHNLESASLKRILMSAPHNQNYDAKSHGMTRAESWKEAYNAIRSYASEILREDKINESN